MVKVVFPFASLEPGKALVAGDLIMDTYTLGKVHRISPEAPVPILNVVGKEDARPGGAGNVAMGLVAMGMEVVALGRTGKDRAGKQIRKCLASNGVDISGIVEEDYYQTPIKNRIISSNQQLIRVDWEKLSTLPENLEQLLIERIPSLLEGVKVVAISDYGKGFLSTCLLAALMEAAKERKIPVVVDPKGEDFSKYDGADVLKPNFSEAIAAVHLPATANLEDIAAKLFQVSRAKHLLITRSEDGISVFHRDKRVRKDFPVKVKEVNDVTGAGDTVLVTMACAVANGLTIEEGAKLSNFAASIAIEHMGCVHVTLSQLARRLLDEDVVNKVFEEEHLYVLQQVLKERRYKILGISSAEGLTTSVFSNISNLSKEKNTDLVLYIREPNPDEKFIEILSSLHDVDLIVIKGESLRSLCRLIHPEEVYYMDGENLRLLDHSESLI